MTKEKDQATAPAEKKAAPRRRQRSIDERIAELLAKQKEQIERRKRSLTKQLAEARAQEATARERLERVVDRIVQLEAQLAQLDPAEDEAEQD